MPYTREQCAKFAIMAKQGGTPPADWQQHCTKHDQAIAARRKAAEIAYSRRARK
jgi:hypothetical protein